MKAWSSHKLADIADLCLGKMLDEKKNKGEPLPYLANVNVRWGEFDLSNLREMRFESHEMERYGLRQGDIVMCEGGEPGRCAIWKSDDPGMMIQKALHRIRPHVGIDPGFLYYSFLQKGRLNEFSALFTGSTIKHLPKQKLELVEILAPPLPLQQRIASILTAYDDLIENNRRRMALLEESARLLYREWFIHLRFPGHESTRFVEGLPVGWERKSLAELCDSVDYGYTASASEEEVGPKFLRITDIVPQVIDWSAVPYCPIEEKRFAKFHLEQGDIVIARTGATVGYAKRMNKLHPESVFASYLVRMRLKPEVDDLLIGIFVESEDYKSFVRSRVGGAAQPNASAPVLTGAEMLIPSHALQRAFRHLAEPIADERELLQIQNQKLKTARDLLLPKLMSGEIAV